MPYPDGAAGGDVKAAHVALATITPDDAVAREDLAGARLALGQASYFDHDYQAALVEFRQARDLLPAPDRGRALYWIAAAAMFEPTNEAVTAAEQGAAVTTASGDHESFGTMRARALLNRGQFQQGLADLERVVKVQGGLTTGKVTLQEVVTRSDLAIAALLNGNTDKAREYLAYTGAGRVEQSPFGLKGDTPAPACGGEGDLRPDDFAIVEFAIGASGAVLSATPIYVSRGGSDAAAAFARAVEGWSWEPATIAKMPAFFRAVTRVELRCTNAGGKGRTGVDALLTARLNEWTAGQGLPERGDAKNDAAALAGERRMLAEARGRGAPGPLAAALLIVAWNKAVGADEEDALLAEAQPLLLKASAPPAVRAVVDLRRAYIVADAKQASSARVRAALLPLLTRDYAADAEVAGTLRLAIASAYPVQSLEQRPYLQAVADDARLPPTDPLKAAALLRLSTMLALNEQVDAARDAYLKTGLDAQQCALVDIRPAMQRSGASSNDFPDEAARWGFEGFVQVEYDVGADGRTLNQRAIVAYPPLVFRDAAVGILKKAKFEQRYRPEGGTGCNAASNAVRFTLGS